MASGMATSDDVVALEAASGQPCAGGEMGRVHRGIRPCRRVRTTPPKRRVQSRNQCSSWDHETLYYSFYRKWRDQVAAAKENRMDGIIVTDDVRVVDDRWTGNVPRRQGCLYRAGYLRRKSNIFEKCWVFLCHESQVANHGDYFWTEIGRQPVYVHRQEDGSLKCFINACSHRAAILTPFRQGNAKTLTCRFHGWTYKCSGDCVGIKNEEEGTDRSKFDLREIASLASYRGFVFGSLSADVPSIEDWLGAAATWIDLMVAQSPDGLEVVR